MNYDRLFEISFLFVMKWEGKESFDTGGYTKWGISQNANPNIDVKQLSLNQVRQIYRKRYWDRLSLDMLPTKIAIAIFDMGVNLGTTRAARFLQRTINEVLHKKILKVDGIIGEKTIEVCRIVHRIGKLDRLLLELFSKRIKFYYKLSGKRKYKKYYKGWINRVSDLMSYIAIVEVG